MLGDDALSARFCMSCPVRPGLCWGSQQGSAASALSSDLIRWNQWGSVAMPRKIPISASIFPSTFPHAARFSCIRRAVTASWPASSGGTFRTHGSPVRAHRTTEETVPCFWRDSFITRPRATTRSLKCTKYCGQHCAWTRTESAMLDGTETQRDRETTSYHTGTSRRRRLLVPTDQLDSTPCPVNTISRGQSVPANRGFEAPFGDRQGARASPVQHSIFGWLAMEKILLSVREFCRWRKGPVSVVHGRRASSCCIQTRLSKLDVVVGWELGARRWRNPCLSDDLIRLSIPSASWQAVPSNHGTHIVSPFSAPPCSSSEG